MSNFGVRTDLALEARECIEEADDNLHGVEVTEYKEGPENVQITKVKITSKNGAKAMGKPIGTYFTLEASELVESDTDYHRDISVSLSQIIRELIPKIEEEQAFLVVGLGNREVTADALGPKVVDNLFITRHMVKEFGKAAYTKEKVNLISSIVPGVMAQTGMETSEIIKGIVLQTSPDVIIVIDALAAKNVRRLNKTIQITDTGIQPGSGVANHRNALTRESLGVPVIAIGVPTVVGAANIVSNAMELMTENDKLEKEVLESELTKVMAELSSLYVTGKDIDEIVKRVSYTISEAVNIALEI